MNTIKYNNSIIQLESCLIHLKNKFKIINNNNNNYGRNKNYYLFPINSNFSEKLIFIERLLNNLKITFTSIKSSNTIGNNSNVVNLYEIYLKEFQEFDNVLIIKESIMELFNQRLCQTLNKHLPSNELIKYQIIINNSTTIQEIENSKTIKQSLLNHIKNETNALISYDQSLRVLYNNLYYSYIKGYESNPITVNFNQFKYNFCQSIINTCIHYLNDEFNKILTCQLELQLQLQQVVPQLNNDTVTIG